MPIGIPNKNHFEPLPESEHETWNINVQEHRADKAGWHLDLRLNPQDSKHAFSWAVRRGLPAPGQKHLAVLQPTHSKEYLGWEGTIPEGYGKGTVKSNLLDKADVIKSSKDELLFNLYQGQNTDKYALIRTNEGKDWLLYNYTGTTVKDIPDYKASYKNILSIPESMFEDENILFSPKIDGAHNIISLRPGKPIETYSYRRSVRSPERRIDHTYKTDLYKIRSPKELGETILRAEMFIPNQSPQVISGVLNSNTWKSRENQKEVGSMSNIIFDVVKFKGKNVENLPYSQKISILKQVEESIPQLKMMDIVSSKEDKKKLFQEIGSAKHPQTKEGLVLIDTNKHAPMKYKFVQDEDVTITGTFEAKPGTKYFGNSVGGFTARTKKGTTIRIGSGLNDDTRRDAFTNPQKYIGSEARIEMQDEFSSGKFRVPIFIEMRS